MLFRSLASPLHNRPINEITSAELLYLLKSIEKSGRRETAKKMRGAISAVFRLAIVTLRAENDPTLPLRDALIPPKVVGRAATTDEKKFGALLRDMEAYTGWRIVIDALKFQILTMTRPGEVRGAKKQEIDLEKRTWTIPAERMKMRREHVIPLSDQALEIVKDSWPEIEGVELLFPSLISNRKWLSDNAFNSALRRMGYQKEEVTAHGFRVTALIRHTAPSVLDPPRQVSRRMNSVTEPVWQYDPSGRVPAGVRLLFAQPLGLWSAG